MHGNRLILMIEDNPDDVELTRRAFEKNRIAGEIVVLKDGAEALEYFQCAGIHEHRDGERVPDLVLLDLKLPKVGGLEILQWIRADDRMKNLPVIILSASEDTRDVITGYERGADCFLHKPIDAAQFFRAAGQLGLPWLVADTSRHDSEERL
jgi:two-component system response regulator